MNKGSRVFVAGHRGLVGSAIVRRLRALGFEQVLCVERSELDLTRQSAVDAWFTSHRPEIVIMAAAKVGGIHANNTYAADFIRDNLAVQTNVIDGAHQRVVRDRQDRGHQDVPGVFAPVRVRCHLADADQSVRAGR
jgi:GDP-L-fucose synthase